MSSSSSQSTPNMNNILEDPETYIELPNRVVEDDDRRMEFSNTLVKECTSDDLKAFIDKHKNKILITDDTSSSFRRDLVVGSIISTFVAYNGLQYILPLFANTAPIYLAEPVNPTIVVLSLTSKNGSPIVILIGVAGYPSISVKGIHSE